MLFEDSYKTIINRPEGIFRDKGSKFIGYACPFSQEDELKSVLIELRNQHPKARHFCWAYRLSPDRNIFRFNDDGEPSGTAGRPILNTLLSADLTNILIVVVRYFGGTLLGVPGLINAYKSATSEALQSAEIIEKIVNDVYEVVFDYPMMNEVMRIIRDEQLHVVNQHFEANCKLRIEVRKSRLDVILSKLQKINSIKLNYLCTI